MSTLKKRSTAILLAVVVIIIGTLFGVHRSINSETAKIEALFYNGVYLTDEKYTQPSIDSQLKKREDAALGLVTIGTKYSNIEKMPEQTDALRQSRLALHDAKNINEKFVANEKMQSAYKALYNAIAQVAMEDSTVAAVKNYSSVLDGAQGVIQKSAYNKVVSDFRSDALGAFPVNILKNLAFAKYPDYFGLEG